MGAVVCSWTSHKLPAVPARLTPRSFGAGDWTGQYPITFSIVGGTGDYDGVFGGKVTFNDNKLDMVLNS